MYYINESTVFTSNSYFKWLYKIIGWSNFYETWDINREIFFGSFGLNLKNLPIIRLKAVKLIYYIV